MHKFTDSLNKEKYEQENMVDRRVFYVTIT